MGCTMNDVSFEELFEAVDECDEAAMKARKLGRLAFIAGKKLTDNVYVTNRWVIHHGWWEIGYNEAKEIITEKLNSGV